MTRYLNFAPLSQDSVPKEKHYFQKWRIIKMDCRQNIWAVLSEWKKQREEETKKIHYFYSKTNQMHQCIKFILFWNDALHVSDGLSVHHQEFKTVHTATGICQTDTGVCLLASRHQYLFDTLSSSFLNSWWWAEGPHETYSVSFQNKTNLIHWCI